MDNPKCKICRRLGEKLLLKGERCFSVKCAFTKRPYPPGQKGKRRSKALSEYGKELAEKQKMRNWYNLRETQFGNYARKALAKKGASSNAASLLIKDLESRLDSFILKLGFASSRPQARQFVTHGYFLVNGKNIDIPSYKLRKGDIVSIRKTAIKKAVFQNLPIILKKRQFPSWISFDLEKMEGKMTAYPSFEEVNPPAEISSIFEFYSK
jgi:small subunit ribosomal protein S4